MDRDARSAPRQFEGDRRTGTGRRTRDQGNLAGKELFGAHGSTRTVHTDLVLDLSRYFS